jgi:undecaprenyl-diphosphatase
MVGYFLFVALYTLFVIKGGMDEVDQWVYGAIEIHPLVEKCLVGVTFLADTKILALFSLITVIILWIWREFKWIFFYLVLMSSGVFLTLFLKLGIKRDRPGGIVEYIDFWGMGGELISYSYPSGHAVKSFLLFGFWILYLKQTSLKNQLHQIVFIFLIACPVFVGVGQILLGRHYLSDVVGGYIIGFAIMLLCKK